MVPRALIDDRTPLARVMVVLFPAIAIAATGLLLADRRTYLALLREDGPVEWATAACDALAAVLAFGLARRSAQQRRFYVLLGVFCAFLAFEEISWGQRVFGITSPDFFQHHSDQREINVHNVVQQWTGLRSKLFGGVALFAYGVVLPLIARGARVQRRIDRLGIVAPPPALIGGFVLGSMLMFDRPTTYEEEIAELVFGLCFCLLTLSEQLARPAKEKGTDRRPVPSSSRPILDR